MQNIIILSKKKVGPVSIKPQPSQASSSTLAERSVESTEEIDKSKTSNPCAERIGEIIEETDKSTTNNTCAERSDESTEGIDNSKTGRPNCTPSKKRPVLLRIQPSKASSPCKERSVRVQSATNDGNGELNTNRNTICNPTPSKKSKNISERSEEYTGTVLDSAGIEGLCLFTLENFVPNVQNIILETVKVDSPCVEPNGLRTAQIEKKQSITFKDFRNNLHEIEIPIENWGATIGLDCISFVNTVIHRTKKCSVITRQLCFTDDMKCQALVLNREVNDIQIGACISKPFESLEAVQNVIFSFAKKKVCVGGPSGSKFTDVYSSVAGVDELGMWRHDRCTLLLRERDRCVYCTKLQASLWHQQSRMKKKTESLNSNKKKDKTAISLLSSDESDD